MEGEFEMKLKDNWTLTELGDKYVAVPVQGGGDNFSGIVRLNETGKDIWQGISDGLGEDEIADRLADTYEGLDKQRALDAVRKVIETLKDGGLLED